MSKKIAVLLFAIGLSSAASVSAFQQNLGQCANDCFRVWQSCKASGTDEALCLEYFQACRDRCGI